MRENVSTASRTNNGGEGIHDYCGAFLTEGLWTPPRKNSIISQEKGNLKREEHKKKKFWVGGGVSF